MSAHDLVSIARLLDRLDPAASGHCCVPGCTHLDVSVHEQDASPPIRLAA